MSEYIYKIKVGYNRCSYLTYLKLYMKAQLISSPICQIDTNLLFSINYCMHEYSSFLGETWWLKLLPTEILSSLKFPPPRHWICVQLLSRDSSPFWLSCSLLHLWIRGVKCCLCEQFRLLNSVYIHFTVRRIRAKWSRFSSEPRLNAQSSFFFGFCF